MNDSHRLPVGDDHYHFCRYYIEDDPIPEYTHASPAAYEAFRDIKYGIRIHWGVYTLNHREASWPLLLELDHAGRQDYQQLYQRFNPKDFSAEKWMEFFQRVGLKMFMITAKHHDGFCMFDTKSRVKQRVNWTALPDPLLPVRQQAAVLLAEAQTAIGDSHARRRSAAALDVRREATDRSPAAQARREVLAAVRSCGGVEDRGGAMNQLILNPDFAIGPIGGLPKPPLLNKFSDIK